MHIELDMKRIAELEQLMGDSRDQLLSMLLQSMSTAIADLESAIGAHDLGRASGAAHACRNDALMVGARPLLDALSELEAASRASQLEPACRALEQLRTIWPATRDELERLSSARETG